ncbi:hypothetical protein PRZ48_011018 [Zasmidium cellare]|uniref:Carrier domain-containing protein n=1 Tax=Zasmidium cellare TaxID=395010 RepID=A0ABR0EB42_ZASCE|nr:hypothetical protein PRZ48_011018 [Zasmidium cellare]
MTTSSYTNSRSLPQAVDELSQRYPENVWMTVPLDSDLSGEWRNVTYRDLACAVDGMLAWAKEALGDYRRASAVIACIGVNDMRHGAVQTALIKAGNKVLLPSPRNSQSGQVSLFQSSKCGLLLHSEGVEAHIESIKAALPEVQTLQIPSFDELCQRGSTSQKLDMPPVNCNDDDQVIILHTSGSTGNPKPIYHTNASINTVAALRDLPAPKDRVNSAHYFLHADKPMLAVAPFFHMMGQAILWRSLLCRAPIVILPPEKPPTPELIIKVIQQARPWSAIFPPSVLEQIAESPGGMESLRMLEYVFFGGGPLATGIGDKLIENTTLLSLIGSTEAGLFPIRVPEDKHDWQYFEWAPGAGITMEADTDGLYEMVVMPADKRYQAVFHTFPGISEWRTKDLFERHPRKKNLWLYKGRKDDVLVLSNGEKFNPVGFEKLLESHPLVKGALVVGQARFQTGLLIEPEWTLLPEDQDPTELLDSVWPFIEKANAASPAHGRVWRSRVAISKKDKAFKRTPKGSIVRRQTVELYKAEIDALYANESGDDEVGKLPVDADISTIKSFLRQAFKSKELDIPESSSDDEDIFSFGVDSLQVLALSSTLNHALGKDRGFTISPRDIYGHPTVNGLADLLSGDAARSGQSQLSREEGMATMVEKYTHGLAKPRSRTSTNRPEKHTYILTGSTGSLGNYILEDLINSQDVDHVYCLNRSADAEARQRQSFDDRGSRADLSKATFLQANFGKEFFGLSEEVYDKLLSCVDVFIHNAWAVDFNKTLQTYEDVHIAGTRRCVDFSLDSRFRAHIVFISSIASVGNYPSTDPDASGVPEQIFDDHRVPIPQGYGESKHVASLILAAASDKAGVPSTIVRAGQLAGPSGEGAPWNRHEWLPSIVISSKALGMLPDTLGEGNTVDWVPMDLAARSVVDISRSRTQPSNDITETCTVSHLVNPKSTTWTELVPAVRKELEAETGREVKVVSFRTWLDKLAACPRTKEEIEQKPGIKLTDFYEGLLSGAGGLPRLATEKTVKLSDTVAKMAPVDSRLMQKWVGQWKE